MSNTTVKAQRRLFGHRNQHIWRLLVVMVIWMIFMALTRFNKFYTLINFQTMASQFPEFGLMALGVMLCMITGGIDLSTVGVANLTAILMAFLLKGLASPEGDLPFLPSRWPLR